MRGPKPRPTRLREAQASANHKKRNRAEAEFEPAHVEDCPAWLTEAARDEWRRLAPDLIALGLLTKADLVPFAVYCQCYARYVEAETFLNEHGTTAELRDDKGAVRAVIPLPQFGISVKMMDKIRQFAAEFGFTPSARGRIELEGLPPGETKEADDLTDEELLAEIEAIKREIAKPARRAGKQVIN
jgi:P27 family predicted phage terminase small subunit